MYRCLDCLSEISSDRFHPEVQGLDEGLKKRMGEYSSVKNQLAALQRRDQYEQPSPVVVIACRCCSDDSFIAASDSVHCRGNLLVRDLTPFVREEHDVQSESLTTLYVAVPKFSVKEWLAKYEGLKVTVGDRPDPVHYVVPRSSQGYTPACRCHCCHCCRCLLLVCMSQAAA